MSALDKTYISLEQCQKAALTLANKLRLSKKDTIYGIPRGGVVPALLLAHACGGAVTENIAFATVIVDDLVDSGNTMKKYVDKFLYANRDLTGNTAAHCALFSKGNHTYVTGIDLPHDTWLVFPWEQGDQDFSQHDIVTRMLQAIGEKIDRPGLIETPNRVVKAWGEWFDGYNIDLKDIFKVFEDGAENYDELVIVRNIPVYSHCEHHIAPFFGVAHIGYIPDKKIIGLSKLSRLVDVFAHRLQVQERLTNDIANAMVEHMNPIGVGVVIECRHMCMESRGINRQGSSTITSAMRGALLERPEARAELLALASK